MALRGEWGSRRCLTAIALAAALSFGAADVGQAAATPTQKAHARKALAKTKKSAKRAKHARHAKQSLTRQRVAAARAPMMEAGAPGLTSSPPDHNAPVTVAQQPANTVTPAAAAAGITISSDAALKPAFDPSIPNYATRCEPDKSVKLTVSSGDTPVSIDGQAAQTGDFQQTVKIAAGQRFTIVTGSGDTAKTYNVRCLPLDFPSYDAQRTGQTQAGYFLMTPTLSLQITSAATPYVALFDDDGVPIWWYRQKDGTPANATVTPDGNLMWNDTFDSTPFGNNWSDHLEKYTLGGKKIGDYRSWFYITDLHEGYQLPNGNVISTSYRRHDNQNLWSIGVPWGVTVLDAGFQVLNKNGWPVFDWSSRGKVNPEESLRWTGALFPYPGVWPVAWDWQHINAVEPDGDGWLVSLRHTDAIYKLDSAGNIEWKLGGTKTPKSLTVLNDPYVQKDGDIPLGGQHDVRLLPDGTITIHDNETGLGRLPRAVRYKIDAQAKTATMVEMLTDPQVTVSACCGSARKLAGGDWVMGWGGVGLSGEYTADGQPLLKIAINNAKFSYRTAPVMPDQLKEADVIAGMDSMNPRAAK